MYDIPIIKTVDEMCDRIFSMSEKELADWLAVKEIDTSDKVRRLDPSNPSDVSLIEVAIGKEVDPMTVHVRDLGGVQIPLGEVIENLANSQFSPLLDPITTGEC